MATKKVTPQPVQISAESKRIFLVLICGLGVWAILQLVVIHVDVPTLWGLMNFHYLRGSLAIILPAVSLAGITTGLLLRTRTNRRATPIEHSRTNMWVIGSLVAVILGVLFLEVQVAWPFLGDGTSYMGMLYNFRESGTITTQRTAAPSLYLLYGVYYLYLEITNTSIDSFFPFTLISFIAGMVFTITALRFASVFSKRRWEQVLLFILLISLAGSLFFFGYVEVYPLQYACVLVYAYLAYRYVHRKAALLTVGLALTLAVVLHLQNLLLAPSFVLLYTLRNAEDRTQSDSGDFAKRMILYAMPVLAIGYVITQTVLFEMFRSDVGSPFIPFSEIGDAQYTLLSGRHLFDIVNYHFLIGGVPLVIVIACLATGGVKAVLRDPYIAFLAINLFFIESFLLGGGFSFGLGRDWDVCASLGIFLALFAIFLLRQRTSGLAEVSRFAIPIVVVSLCTIIAWITINANMHASADRYQDLLGLYAPHVEKKITSRGYENLRKYQQRVDIAGELVTIRKMLELHPTPADARQGMVAVNSMQGISTSAKEEVLRILAVLESLSDSTLQQVWFDKVRVGDPRGEQASTLGDFFSEYLIFLHKPADALTLDEAVKRSIQFVGKHPELPYGYETFAYFLTTYAGRPADAIAPLNRAVLLDSSRARPYFYLGVALYRSGKREESFQAFRKGLTCDPDAKWGLGEYVKYLTKEPLVPHEQQYLVDVKASVVRGLNAPPKSSLYAQQDEADKALLKGLLQNIDIRLSEYARNLPAQPGNR